MIHTNNMWMIAVCGIIAVTASCAQAQALNKDDISRISSQNGAALNRHNEASIKCGDTYLPQITALQRQFRDSHIVHNDWVTNDTSKRETEGTKAILDALEKCHIAADSRLKSELSGNLPEPKSHSQTLLVHDRAMLNHDAVERYNGENTACQQRYMTPVSKQFEQGPKPQKAGDDVFNWQARILGEALDKWGECSVEAAARLKAQLR
jgi:hypothetical protein